MASTFTVALAAILSLTASGLDEKTLTGSGRKYLVYTPPSPTRPAPDKAGARTLWPVVILFHPLGSNPQQMADVTAFNDLAKDEGFVVVYGVTASASGAAWNAGDCCTGSNAPDDVAYVKELLGQLKSSGSGFDGDRIYVAGMSNGAMLAHRLAAEADVGKQIAAMGTVAGTIAHQLPLAAPCPLIHFHGDADTIVSYQNGGKRFGTGRDMEQRWIANNGCGATAQVDAVMSPSGGASQVERATWSTSTGANPIVRYLIAGGGHTWPGGLSPQSLPGLPGGLGAVSQEISATKEMWLFFKAFEK